MYKILLSAMIVCSGSQAMAQEDSTIVDLQEIIIKENRIEIPFHKISRNITVIQRKEIETTPARSLQEVLSFTPGVDVRQRGVSGVQADIGIRGGSFEQTLMLINGIKLTDPQTGHHMMNIPVPLAGVQRVDVLKGPASRIYGQNAYTGAINIITAIPETKGLSFSGYGGDFGIRGGNILVSLPVGKYRQSIAASHDASNGHWYNSDYRVNNVFYEGALTPNDNHTIHAMAAFTNREFGANGFYTSTFPDQFESIQTYLASLSHTYESDYFYLQSRAYWRRNVDEFLLIREDPSFFQNNHTTDILALEFNGRYQSKWGTTGVGLEGREEKINSNNLGERDRLLVGTFLEHRLEFNEKGDFRAGVYSNYYSEYNWKHFPGAELGYQIFPLVRLYANYGVSFRIPSYTDLYYVGPSNIGNDQLEPEKAQNYEGGIRFSKEKFRFEAVYFNRHTKNLIEWTRPDAATPWQPQNFNEVVFQGIETGINYQFDNSDSPIALQGFSFSYNYIHANLIEQEGQETLYSLNALKHQLIGGIQTKILQKAELTLKARYIERMMLDPYFLLDARLDYNRLKTLSFFLETSNITNADYIEAGTVQMPGRWAKAGISVNLR